MSTTSGVSHGANRAFVELAGQGFVTSGSVMVPCAWFAEMVELAQEQPALDLGVHLTLDQRIARLPLAADLDLVARLRPDRRRRLHVAGRAVGAPARRSARGRDRVAGADRGGARRPGSTSPTSTPTWAPPRRPEFAEIYARARPRVPAAGPACRDSIELRSRCSTMGPVDRDLYARLIAELERGKACR